MNRMSTKLTALIQRKLSRVQSRHAWVFGAEVGLCFRIVLYVCPYSNFKFIRFILCFRTRVLLHLWLVDINHVDPAVDEASSPKQ